MTESPLVSIVLPTYNGSRYLAEAVESCHAQSYRNWELVIVDDGSTDATPDLIARLCAAESRIRAFRNDVNRKLPGTLNRGFREARGSFLTWMSDDNLQRPDSMAKMVAFLEQRPDLDAVYTDCTVIDPDGRPVSKLTVQDPEVLAEHNCVGLCFLYRRRLMEKVGDYAEDCFLAEDYDFWLRAFARGSLSPLHEDLHQIRRHPGSLTDRFPEQVLAVTCRVLERNLPDLRRYRPDVALRAEVVLARRWLDLGETSRARMTFFSALSQHPLRVWSNLDGPRLPVTSFLGSWVAGRLMGARDRFRGGGRGVAAP